MYIFEGIVGNGNKFCCGPFLLEALLTSMEALSVILFALPCHTQLLHNKGRPPLLILWGQFCANGRGDCDGLVNNNNNASRVSSNGSLAFLLVNAPRISERKTLALQLCKVFSLAAQMIPLKITYYISKIILGSTDA